MKPNEPMEQLDPVVDRVREVRRALVKECSYDLARLADYLRSLESRHPERLWSKDDVARERTLRRP